MIGSRAVGNPRNALEHVFATSADDLNARDRQVKIYAMSHGLVARNKIDFAGSRASRPG